MKNSGFTLVELLAVIVLLSILIIVFGTNIVGNIKNVNKKIDSSLESIFLSSVEDYVNDNLDNYNLYSSKSSCIQFKEIINKDYLNKSLFNQQSILDENSYVIISNNGEKFKYEIDYNNICNKKLEKHILMSISSSEVYGPWNYKTSIESVFTLDTIPDNMPNDLKWDVSSLKDKSIYAYLKDEDNNGLYELYFASNGIIQLNENSSNLFKQFTNLKRLDLSDFDTSNVTDISNMFYECNNLISVNLNNFNTSLVTSMKSMFYNCQSLTTLDLSNFDTSNVIDMSEMFRNTSSIVSIKVSSNFVINNNATNMFTGSNVNSVVYIN